MWGQVYSRHGKGANKEQGAARAATEAEEGGAAAPKNRVS
jgi:hypothetical protein